MAPGLQLLVGLAKNSKGQTLEDGSGAYALGVSSNWG